MKAKVFGCNQSEKEYNKIINAQANIIVTDSMEIALKDEHIKYLTSQLKNSNRKIKTLKFGIISIPIAGLALGTLIAIKK